MKRRVFLDAAVLFSAALSKTGASRELLRLAQLGDVKLITNEFAVAEADRNLVAKVPESVILLRVLLRLDLIEVFPNPPKELVEAVATYTELKDAPIVAGAIETTSDYLATFDRKHLIDPPIVAANSGLFIGTAGDVLNKVRVD